jgi:DNA polymerase III gamma/tau subunit
MYQVIARKYRPRLFAELVNQQHVRDTLERAITEGRVAHSYIFSGQRGVGKTTVARLLARCLNCTGGPTITPCGACKSCREMDMGNAADVIQIDAASNRGINEMRELRENVRFQPARDRYRVFTRALLDSDSRRMLEIVGTLVREGHDLQQFWRGLTRHFRNLLVIKIAGAGRLIAAPSSEQERLRDIADRFSQEDLIRYLDLMLGLGEDLQWNVSQRAYLELGLVKLVQASKLPLIEAEVTRLNGTGANAT